MASSPWSPASRRRTVRRSRGDQRRRRPARVRSGSRTTATYRVKRGHQEASSKSSGTAGAVHHEQASAGRRPTGFGFTAKRTMQVAQGLYEGVELGEGRRARSVSSPTCVLTPSAPVPRRSTRSPRVRDSIARSSMARRTMPEKPNTFKVQEEHAGRARSHPPGESLELAPGVDQEAPERRAVQALQDDLGPLLRLAR